VPGDEITGSPPAAPPRPAGEFTDVPRYREDERDEFDRPDGPREGPGLEGLSNTYSITIGEWFRYAQAHWSAVVGPMIGYLLLYILITIGLVITCVGIPALIFLVPPLAAGFTLVPLAQLKGERWTFGDFFGGFRQYWPVFGGTWLVILLTSLWPLPGIVLQQVGEAKYQAEANAQLRARLEANQDNPFAEVAGMQQQQQVHLEDPLVVSGLVLRLIGQLVGLYFSVRCLFAVPLILDRKCGAVECIQGSFLLTGGHFWGLLGVLLLLGLINVGGLLLCGIGLLLTIPFTQLVLVAGYLFIAGTRPPVDTPQIEPAA
jgi:hypothetical protein